MTPAVRRTFGDVRIARLQRVRTRAVPSGRLLSAEEVARVVAWLASDAASFFNGATLDLTGGEAQHLMEVLLQDDVERGSGPPSTP